MSTRSRRLTGFTLIEMVIAIVVIGVGLAGVLTVYNITVKSSADPLIHKQMLAVAEEMMEEILLKPYTPGSGTISGCNRAAADDVSDYAGYSQPICDIDGTAVPGLSGYSVAVAVNASATLATLSSGVKKVTVTVTHGGDSLVLVGWRTDYGS